MAASPDETNSISQLGEQQLIRRVFAKGPVSNSPAVVGIGDDCAVLSSGAEDYQLVTTDQLTEGVHFLTSLSSPADIGYKSVAVNFSDIAAMGGWPVGIFLSLGLPATVSISWVKEFSNGFFELCQAYEIPLLGGDTAGSKIGIVINVTVLGTVDKRNIKLRSQAQTNDIVCVTGTLGDAAAGLRLMQEKTPDRFEKQTFSFLARCHRRPYPAMKQGQWLAAHPEVHAMIDISDGVVTDGKHVCEQSKVGMRIDAEQLPLSKSFKKYTAANEELIKKLSLGGGEDYHLLCTVASDSFDELKKKFEKKFGSPLYRIGLVEEGTSTLKIFDKGKEIDESILEFDHFQQ